MNPATAGVLVLNGGSFSIKYPLYWSGESLKRQLHGQIEPASRKLPASDQKAAVKDLILCQSIL